MNNALKLAVFYGWGVVEPVADGDRADEAVDALMTRFGPTGFRVTGSFGPLLDDGSCQPTLDIAITHENAEACLKWGEDFAVEPDFDNRADQSRTFDDGIAGTTDVPSHHLRVSRGRARQAVREYIETGKRPTCVEWKPATQ